MDDFERMMGMEGVRPLDRPKNKACRPAQAPRQIERQTVGLAEAPATHAWATGARARNALDTALERLASEIRDDRRGWAIGIRQDGSTVTLPASSGAASLLSAADRQKLRLMIVGGDNWTFVMHPLMGVATLDEDPR